MKYTLFIAIWVLAFLATSFTAKAGLLEMEYHTTDLGNGTYTYDFTLELVNSDGSFTPGMEWDWIIFGDCGAFCTSPLTDWISLTADSHSTGGHNGPTIGLVDGSVAGAFWAPQIGDSIEWSGTSTALLEQGELFWTTIYATSGAPFYNMETALHANHLAFDAVQEPNASKIPEPSTLAIFALGMIGLASRRFKKQS